MEILIGLVAVLILGFVPMIFYSAILWWFDRYEKEPLRLLVTAFLWGAIPAILFSLIAQLVFDVPISLLVRPGLQADLLSTSFIAPVTEEVFKGAMILLLLFIVGREIDTPLDGIIYGGLVGCGFAATENVLYFFSEFSVGGLPSVLTLAFLRAVLFGLNHALYTACTGLGVAIAHTSPRKLVKIGAPVLGLALGIMLHAAHNAAITLSASFGWMVLVSIAINWAGVFAVFVAIVWISLRERLWISTHLLEEVDIGTLSKSDYAVIQSYLKRSGARIEALAQFDIQRWVDLGRFYRLATKLAFIKQRWEAQGQEHDQETFLIIEDLRRQLYQMRSRL